MATDAQIAANIQNAKKSTGPRTPEGKDRSRMNALDHGMTALLALLPDEDPAEFQARKSGWVADLKPRNRVELFMAESVAYHAWQAERSRRAQSARLCFRANTSEQEEAYRIEQKVVELGDPAFPDAACVRPAVGETSDKDVGAGAKSPGGH